MEVRVWSGEWGREEIGGREGGIVACFFLLLLLLLLLWVGDGVR